MITDQLDKCPFCQADLSIRNIPFKYLDCPSGSSHPDFLIWAYFRESKNPELISDVNIRFPKYQLCFDLIGNTTKLTIVDYNKRNMVDHIVEFNYLLDFELTKEDIERKINMMLAFQ